MAKRGREGKSGGIGNRIAPPRFIAGGVIAVVASAIFWGASRDWRLAILLGFDAAAIVFLVSCISLFDNEASEMRAAAKANDANRVGLLAITGVVMLVILVAIGAELRLGQQSAGAAMLIVATLVIAWLFSNMVYTLHYAHLFYSEGPEGGDSGGLGFPHVREPDYWDFAYFSFTLGMTFQTSDVDIFDHDIRRTVLLHSIAAFVFNIGVLAFTINVLGG
ncbi:MULTISPECIES: DUF1345 domain-containing protein [Sphingomonas]|uniref:DUF1345 domain-containing protein n=1 Tax=Edaphosphingomonas fennica TaxID=114404 RepID=A0A2T4HJS9_9SPHN|nr:MULTISPECIES: DUF1345 domain-containing protein [Sphingomonas]AGH49383.1 hypothetical protein G432_08290 [Sphingomonas sp. MM-1]MDX3885932.1 DUF1345 domain-containing protein [Sphingomonas sp.]PTD16045.1 DUF1345 domain-containing protein [Sphingomonas fennica]